MPKKAVLVFDMPDDFENGDCNKCPFRKSHDQCYIEHLLTQGANNLNCFCKLHVLNAEQYDNLHNNGISL